MATTQAILRGKDTTAQGELYIASSWATSSGRSLRATASAPPAATASRQATRRRWLTASGKAKARFGLPDEAKVHSCYEAGRDGWWLHRWLLEQGIDNIVVDSASIEVNRRARRAKNDRLDGDKLLAMLLRHHARRARLVGAARAEPEREDARRVDRELQRLTHERTAHTNRIGSLLVLHNLRPADRHRRPRLGGLVGQPSRAGAADVARGDRARGSHGWSWSRSRSRRSRPRAARAGRRASSRWSRQLGRLRAIGPRARWMLDKELFGWRRFANRRELAASLGLTPTPYDSGDSQIEQGISKAGNKRVRSLAGRAGVELAAPAARQRADAVVQPALRGGGQAHAPRRHRGPGPAPGHRAVAIPASTARSRPVRS